MDQRLYIKSFVVDRFRLKRDARSKAAVYRVILSTALQKIYYVIKDSLENFAAGCRMVLNLADHEKEKSDEGRPNWLSVNR